MRVELWIGLVTACALWYIHTDGVYVKRLLNAQLVAKKQLYMGGVVLAALFFYYLVKKDPLYAKEVLVASSDYVKYMPLDRQTKDMITPLLDLTQRPWSGPVDDRASRIVTSSGGTRRRSVSETKKKFVAARQNWLCAHCGTQLTAWFEVDHKVRLEHGGSNHVDNLCALCAECHRHKSGMETME
jgi:5-methylcytosine-specific restriction endonuclease McrA